MPSIRVGAYYIYLRNLNKSLPHLLEDYDQYCILIEPASKEYALPIFQKNLDLIKSFTIELDYSEHNKTLDTCAYVWDKLIENQATDRTLMINLGSGTLCDIGAFCAATYRFGIDFIHVPTTLVAMVGASVGGKMGIDYRNIKNALGVYKNPKAVFIEVEFLKTLPKPYFDSGIVEITKYGLLAGGALWRMIKKKEVVHADNIRSYLEKALIIKKQILETDPLERGLAKIIDFGNTIGHALQRYLRDQQIHHYHGEYIAAGIICEAYLSQLVYGHDEDWMKTIEAYILPYSFKGKIADKELNDIADTLTYFRHQKQDQVYLTLLKDIGSPRYEVRVTKDTILESLRYWNDLVKD